MKAANDSGAETGIEPQAAELRSAADALSRCLDLLVSCAAPVPEDDPLIAQLRDAADALSRRLDRLGSPSAQVPPEDMRTMARKVYDLRRARDAAFPHLFGDPAWDVMLHLYQHGRVAVTASAAAKASCAAGAAGGRFVQALIHEGLLNASGDTVELSDAGFARMERWIAEAERTSRPAAGP